MEKEKKVKDIISKQFEVKKFLSAMYRDNGIDLGYLYIYAAWLDSCSESFDNN